MFLCLNWRIQWKKHKIFIDDVNKEEAGETQPHEDVQICVLCMKHEWFFCQCEWIMLRTQDQRDKAEVKCNLLICFHNASFDPFMRFCQTLPVQAGDNEYTWIKASVLVLAFWFMRALYEVEQTWSLCWFGEKGRPKNTSCRDWKNHSTCRFP